MHVLCAQRYLGYFLMFLVSIKTFIKSFELIFSFPDFPGFYFRRKTMISRSRYDF
jgi:hypothetical protein